MGHRHQIYVRLASGKVIGLHHQWLYGSQPLRQLHQFLLFVAAGPKRPFLTPWSGDSAYMVEHAQGALKAIYSVLLSDGSHREVDVLDAEVCANPRLIDNNDGITVVDLSGPAPKYAFAFVNGGGDPDVERSGQNTTLSAAAYLGYYYAPQGEGTDWAREREAPDGSWECVADLGGYEVLSATELRSVFPGLFKRGRKSAA